MCEIILQEVYLGSIRFVVQIIRGMLVAIRSCVMKYEFLYVDPNYTQQRLIRISQE